MDPEKAAKLKRRTLVGATLVLVLVALLWVASLAQGARFVAAFGTLLAILGVWEARRMGLPWKGTPLAVLILAVVSAQTVWIALWDPAWPTGWDTLGPHARYGLAFGLAFWVPAGIVGLYRAASATSVEESQPPPAAGDPTQRDRWLCVLWLCAPLACLYPVRLFGGVSALIALVILSKLGDIAGYYVGSLIGKTKPFPKLSPGKTTAGCVGSFLAGTAAGIGCQVGGLLTVAPGSLLAGLDSVWVGQGWLAGALAGASINLAAQAGDLYESFWKRKTGVKDSGDWFGPSGGMLDLVDSLLWSAPLAAATWPFLFGWLGDSLGLG